MDRIARMLQLMLRVDRSLIVAGLFSVGCFGYVCLDYFRHGLLQAGAASRFAVVMVLVFILLAGIMRVMDADIAAEVSRLSDSDPPRSRAVFLFVVTKALVRMMLGVTIILTWLVGLLLIFDRSAAWGFLPALLSAAGYSCLCFGVAFGVVSFVDRIDYPDGISG